MMNSVVKTGTARRRSTYAVAIPLRMGMRACRKSASRRPSTMATTSEAKVISTVVSAPFSRTGRKTGNRTKKMRQKANASFVTSGRPPSPAWEIGHMDRSSLQHRPQKRPRPGVLGRSKDRLGAALLHDHAVVDKED